MFLQGPANAQHLFLVAPSYRDKKALLEMQAPPYTVHTLEPKNFTYLTANEEFDAVGYLDECRSYLKRNKIDGLLFSHDIAAIYAAILAKEFGLLAPSIESVFRATHKHFSRQCEANPVESRLINIWEPDFNPNSLTYPCIVKPPLLVFSKFQRVVHAPAELMTSIAELREVLPAWNSLYKSLFDHALDLSKFPGALEDTILVERIIRMPQYCIEGYSRGSKHIPWAISSATYSSDQRIALDYYMTPTVLSTGQQERAWQAAVDTVERHGLTDTFWNVELWADDNDILITELNPRAASVWHWLYKNAYNTSLYEAMMHFAVGEIDEVNAMSPLESKLRPNAHAMQFHIVTYAEGIACDLLDYDAPKTMHPMIKIDWFFERYEMIRQESSMGLVVARFELLDHDVEGAYQVASDVRRSILRDISQSPYLEIRAQPCVNL